MSIAALVQKGRYASQTTTKRSLAIPVMAGGAVVVRINVDINLADTDGNSSFLAVVCPISRLAEAAPSSRFWIVERSGVFGAIATSIFTSTAYTGWDGNGIS
jgi:hypothetical protein